ncbi:MAG: 4Fe-4S binding protein [Gammaproteobacteria bacterium]|nr:4Fe-4S binding protein [Gammaproteobacteria bacterium]
MNFDKRTDIVLPGSRRIYLALMMLGAFSQIAQALLIREFLVVFYGNEAGFGAFYGSWLLWIALGSFGIARFYKRFVQGLKLFFPIFIALPVILAIQIGITRIVRLFIESSSAEFISLGDLFVAVFLITMPAGLALGVAFPLGCRVLRACRQEESSMRAARIQDDVRDVSKLYVFEALGAFAGGVLFTFVFIEWLGVWRSLGLTALLMALAGGALVSGRTRLAAAVIGLAGLIGFLTPLGGTLHQYAEKLRFATLHPGLTLLDTKETRYGHVAAARFGQQISIINDGRITGSFPNPERSAQEAAYYYTQSGGARKILLFGGTADGLAAELLRYPLQRLDVVQQDQPAFELIRRYLPEKTLHALENPRLRLHFLDGRRFVNRLPSEPIYELVLVLAPDPSSAHQNRYFTREFYSRMRASMTATGVLCTQADSASNYLGKDVKSYSGSIFHTLKQVFPHITVMPGDTHVFCASASPGIVSTNPLVLKKRYENIELAERVFPAAGFLSLLPADRIAFVRKNLEKEAAEVNTDLKPVTYYLNMILWGKFTASGFTDFLSVLQGLGIWPYLIPLLVFTVLFMLRLLLEKNGKGRPMAQRRAGAVFALAALGFIAMAAELQLIFSYQAHAGFVFSRIALLNGMFMTGLALGAGIIGRRLAGSRFTGFALAAVLALVAGACAGLPTVLQALARLDGPVQETVYVVLVTLTGLLTGIGFPLGVHLTHLSSRNVVRTSGVTEAADHLGGAAGGLLTGAFLVPILGIAGVSRLLGIIAAVTLALVLFTELFSQSPIFFRTRGYRSFPFARVSWVLAFAVLTVFAISSLVRTAAPGPMVRFEQALLAETSGSKNFDFFEQPMPYYLGTAKEEKRTISLASMPVAADIRGYAGPVNLLVSADEKGLLKGLKYLHSDETPSYIYGIQDWLNTLVGRDLSKKALHLGDVDALAGATVSAEAALASVNRAANMGGRHAFQADFAPSSAEAEISLTDNLAAPEFLLTLALLLLFFPVYFSGRDRVRLWYQAAVLLGFGLVFNTLFTEIDLVNISLGHLPSVAGNPRWYLLAGFVVLTSLLFGQVYCGCVCPFGALQEFISRLGRLLSLRAYAERGLEMHMRYVKYILLAIALSAGWVTGEILWISFNPMQHFFNFHWRGWIAAVIAVSLTGALFYYRFWFRCFCPLGAFLALGNKSALLHRFTPKRRFKHCDLGVRNEFDVDCIRCSRCITRADIGMRKKNSETTKYAKHTKKNGPPASALCHPGAIPRTKPDAPL